MAKHNLLFLWITLCFSTLQQSDAQKASSRTVIAFGSCGHESDPQPVLKLAAELHPDFFIFLGDNIYGDTYDMEVLKAKYAMLAAKPEFQALKKSTKLLATWDDHDYGDNDSGRHYPFKLQSKNIFLDFFEVPASSSRRKHEGIYSSEYYRYGKKTLQVILLDTRTFRDNLRKYNGEMQKEDRYFYQLDYYPYDTPDSTLLGVAQWQWLEAELSRPADVRIICSSTQFGIEFNGYEAWANFPHEQQKMLDIIQRTKAEGVIFLSGDVHYSEISRMESAGMYPIYDFTASGITSTWHFATPNKNRIEGPVMDNHFGLVTIDWTRRDPLIRLETIDVTGNQRLEYTIPLSRLKFATKSTPPRR